MEQTKTMRTKFLLLAALCCFSFQGISQTLCVETGSPVGGSPGSASANFAQSVTMGGGCTGLFAGITVDGSTIVGAGNPVWTLEIFQGNGFGGTLQYTQTGIALTNAGAGYIFINIEGGSGSRAFTPGNQYTFRISTATAMNTLVVFRNNTSFYSGGQGYLDGATFGTGGDLLDVNIFTETATSSCGAATRLYVKHNASGSNNGTSWTNAYTNLQSAIDYARGCSNIQEIWVSSGTYKPSKDRTGNASPSNPTSKTFFINFPIALYGGFAGTETLLSQRNLVSNVTILSGDLDNNDTASPAVTAADVQGSNANIVLHIQNVAAGFTADGFTIAAGQFTSGFAGGGIHHEGTGFPFGVNSTIRNCKIQGNAGPGIFNSGNLGNNAAGRAILLVENSTISGNSEDFYGAGIHSNSNGGYTNTTVNNCTFSNNTSTGTSHSGAYMESAPSGNGAATFSKCIFSGNSATANGAAVHANGSSSGIVNHSFTNCIFLNNTAGGKGGAFYSNSNSSSNVSSGFTNCTFYNNSATNGGSAVASTTNNINAPPLLLRNCILWQNTNEILNEGVASTTLSYSLINGASAPAGTATENSLFNINPNFVNAAGGNLRLQDCSPAVNSGTSTGAPATDLDNNPRPALGGFDMGAYESQSGDGTTTYYRDMDGDTFGNPAMTQVACSPPTGYVTNNTDCDDNDPLEKPGQVWYDDTDNDGYGQTGAASITQCLRPTGYRAAVELLATSGDCNDNNAAIKPGATEVCDGVDNDCDGMNDEGVLTTYYRDMDGDTFGNPAMTQQACSQPTGYVTNNTDCDDNDPLEKPGQVWYKDTDNDGYGQTGASPLTQCLRPTGYKVAAELTATTGDCNDNNAAIKPGATEVCDGVDNDCDGMTDEGVLTTYYRDMDGDTFGNPAMTQQACSQPTGYVTNNTDCDDNDPLEKPGQVWYDDTDNDGYGQTGASPLTQCLRPTGYRAAVELLATSGDCNDNNAAIKPGATESCDGVDNDCDGSTDEGLTFVTYYTDADGDGYGTGAGQSLCANPGAGFATQAGDCNDNDDEINPGETESCDGIDNDCDGSTDEGLTFVTYYTDADGDGYGTGAGQSLCANPGTGFATQAGDCNDNDDEINPGETESCDSIDNDCDGSTDEGLTFVTYYTDADGDGYGTGAGQSLCANPGTGFATQAGDCNDNDDEINPGETESCDGIDNDCDGSTDEGLTFVTYYTDADGDGYGTGSGQSLCANPGAGFATQAGDCNDNDDEINPGETESCDGIDNNCDSQIDNGALITYYQDSDGDGFGNAAMNQQACSQPTGYVANDDDCDDNDEFEFPGQVWYKDADGDDYSDGMTLTQCLRPTNYFVANELIATSGDCNDAVAAINPAATEICDEIDNDCDGMTDESVQTTYYEDTDMDGFGDPNSFTMACSVPTGYVANDDDCDDMDALEFPGQVWYKDADGDDYSDGATLTQCLRPTNYFVANELIATSGDCNDAVAAINPAATEICDEIDNDCDGSTDEGLTFTTYYTDADGDGYGTGAGQSLCANPGAGFATQAGDCNDNNDDINPGATEICDGIDNDCDGSTDEGVQTTYYRDMDGDGFGNPAMTQVGCSPPTGYVTNNTDCDDNDALEKPGQTWYADADNDGYSTGIFLVQCLRPAGFKVAAELTATIGDCNDSNDAINPDATEVCDGVDNDCDGQIDNGTLNTYYRDMDGDGFGNPANTTMACSIPTGYVANNTDCDDNDALEFPGQVWYADVDNDGYSTGTTLTQCLRPVGYKAAVELTAPTGDCNDNAAAINPVATEICDGIDNNCNGSTDEGVQTTYYRDMDSDGFGNPSNTTLACSLPSGYVTNNTDCDDNDALEKPGQVWYADVDNDGYSTGSTLTQCLRPTGYKVPAELTATTGDCNDNAAAINPAATEVCDGIDNDCDGQIDDGVLNTYYRDLDGDGFGNPANTTMACSLPSGYVANNTDCDDNDALEFPGQVWFADVDNDGYSTGATLTQCLRPVGYKAAAELTATSGDCNDNASAINPAATEVCDGIDNNCNGSTDEGVQTTYYRDMDGDGFGNPSNTTLACSLPSGYVTNNTDCDDNDALEKPGQVWYADVDNDGYSNGATLTQCLRPVGYKVPAELTATSGDCNDNSAAIKPGALEICDGVDNDCDGQTDEGVKTVYYADADGDGFGDPNNTITECSQPQGYVTNSEDCDDTDDTVYPGAEEICDDKDNDCNGVTDDIGGTTAGNWNNGNVGGANGGANFPPCNAEPTDVFTINATGFSTSSSDKIQAVYQELCGNGEIIARVLNVQNGGWAGIMLRETLDPGSKKVSLKTQLTPSIRREIRSMTNGAASILNFNRPQHVWLRLTRSGSNFVGYTSTDGANWSFAFAATISMNGCIYAGLFSESINASVTTIATFDNVSIIRETENLSRPGAPIAASLDGQRPEMSATIYPNPTEGRVTVRFTEVLENRATIRVFNTLGEQVISKQITTLNEVTDDLDLSELPDGVYSIQIAVPGHTPLTKRVVLAKASGLKP